MPLWLNLLTAIVGNNAIFFPDLNQYLSFLTLLIVAFGVTFELPVVDRPARAARSRLVSLAPAAPEDGLAGRRGRR